MPERSLCSVGRMVDARDVFRLMESHGCECNVITYNTLICGCEAEMVKEAHNMFLEMEAKGCSPEIATFCPLIGGFARQKEFDIVKELLMKMHAMKIPMDLQCIVVECIKKMDDGLSWINSIPDFSTWKTAADAEVVKGHRGSASLRIEAFVTLRVLVAKIGINMQANQVSSFALQGSRFVKPGMNDNSTIEKATDYEAALGTCPNP